MAAFAEFSPGAGGEKRPMADAAGSNSLWAHTLLKVVSLCPDSRGEVLVEKVFCERQEGVFSTFYIKLVVFLAPNAITVSISPAMNHLLVGVASKRYLRFRHLSQVIKNIILLPTNVN